MAASTVDEYLATFPLEQRAVLQRVRETLLAQVPGATEKIRYGMPAIMLGGRYAIHFAGWKKHVGLYPVPVLSPNLEVELAPFRSGKDSVNLPYSEPLPYELLSRMAAALVALRGSRP
ncbi:MAG: DUF1801 domain-containing protein, partial [Rhodoglobus sp.]